MHASNITLLLAFLTLALAHPRGLHYGSPETVGLLREPLEALVGNVTAYTQAANYGAPTFNKTHPVEPGSVTLVAKDATIVQFFAAGHRNLYADVNGTFLPAHLQESTTKDTIYDMASLTKLFTAVAALRELDSGRLHLDRAVASYLPDFAVHGKEAITILELLTHTSGFDADPDPPLYSTNYTNYDERVEAILSQHIINEPGSKYLYSDLNFMTLFLVLEKVTGRPLDELIYSYTRPLGMHSTFFNRGNVEGASFSPYNKMATQEFQIDVLGPEEPQRPQPVRGTVHDENAWALNGVSGHAGLFSTVADTAIFCQMILNNGSYAGKQYLKPATVDLIFHNYNERFPGNAHGLGFELNQTYWAGPMASLQTAGHTGFTGTTLAIDRPTNTAFLHFSNRVHPSRKWSSNNIVREAVGYWVAESLGRQVNFPY